MKKFIHHIVTTETREITNCEMIYCNSNKPKNSMKMYLKFMKNVQYEIVNRETNQIEIIILKKTKL